MPHSWSTTHRFLGRPESDTEVLFCYRVTHSSVISYCFRQLLKPWMSPLCALDCCISSFCFKIEHSLWVFLDTVAVHLKCACKFKTPVWCCVKVLQLEVPISLGFVPACRPKKQCSPSTIVFNVSYGRKSTTQWQTKAVLQPPRWKQQTNLCMCMNAKSILNFKHCTNHNFKNLIKKVSLSENH